MRTLTGCLLAVAASSLHAAYQWGNVAFEGGGFVDGLVTSKTQAGLVYARTDVGGAYRWDSLGGKWIPLMDWVSERDNPLYGTEAIALDPQDSKRVFILCGMHYNEQGKSMILRSFDYGATFDTVNITKQFKAHGNGMGRQTGERLAVDPQNSAILFCGTRLHGLWKSTDTGKTWSLASDLAASSNTGIANLPSINGISYVIFDPTSGKTATGGTKTIYVGVSSNTNSVYVSNDGGTTFTAVAGAPSQMAMRALLSEGFLYGTFSAGPGPFNQTGGSVWKMNTATSAWTNIGPKTDSGFVYGTGHEGYGYAFGGITVDAKNPKRLVVATESFYGGNNTWPDGKGNAGDAFFLSEDAGATWKQLNPWSATTPTVDPNGNNWISGSSIHWAGTIEFDPFDSKKVWVGSGNGVFRTDDVAAEVPLWKFQSKGIEETVPKDLVSVPGGPLVTAIMDYDGATYDDITKSSPQHANPIGSSNSLGYAAKAGWFVRSGRVTDYNVKPQAVTYDVMYLSKDMGRTWTKTDTATLPGSSGTLALSTDGSVILMRPSYMHNGIGASPSKFYRSADGGKTWQVVSGLNSEKGMMVSDPVNPLKFYILPDGYQGDFMASLDGGATFTKVGSVIDNASGNTSASSSMLRAAPGVEGDLWVCLDAEQSWNASGYSSNGLAHSTDGGKTWTRINTMTACLTMGLGKAAPGADYFTLYMWGKVGSGPLGIYRSIDKGQTWLRINDDQHQFGGPGGNGNFVIGDFNVYGRVYMSTVGRGLIYGQPEGTVSVKPRVRSASNVRVARKGSLLQIQGLEGRDLRIDLVGMDGRILSSKNLGADRNVSLEGLPRGVLFARVRSSAGLESVAKILRD